MAEGRPRAPVHGRGPRHGPAGRQLDGQRRRVSRGDGGANEPEGAAAHRRPAGEDRSAAAGDRVDPLAGRRRRPVPGRREPQLGRLRLGAAVREGAPDRRHSGRDDQQQNVTAGRAHRVPGRGHGQAGPGDGLERLAERAYEDGTDWTQLRTVPRGMRTGK